MKKNIQTLATKDGQTGTHYHTSFILRCWQDNGDSLRARLVDVNSGISYPVPDLDKLPELVWHLLQQMHFSLPPSTTNHTTEDNLDKP